MAAIGPGWATDAWIEASWIARAWGEAAAFGRYTVHRGKGVTFSSSVREDLRVGKEDVSQES